MVPMFCYFLVTIVIVIVIVVVIVVIVIVQVENSLVYNSFSLIGKF